MKYADMVINMLESNEIDTSDIGKGRFLKLEGEIMKKAREFDNAEFDDKNNINVLNTMMFDLSTEYFA